MELINHLEAYINDRKVSDSMRLFFGTAIILKGQNALNIKDPIEFRKAEIERMTKVKQN